MILLLALIGLISCTTTDNIEESFDSTPILINMIPDLPEIPTFPKLNWNFETDKYYINEEDVDKLLNYGEYELPLYRYEMDIYRKQLGLILKEIIKK